MDTIELTRLQRIAQNLPPQRMRFAKTDTKFGPLYIAWGKRHDIWYGIWGICGIAQIMELKPATGLALVKMVLVHHAMQFAADMTKAGLLDQGRISFHA